MCVYAYVVCMWVCVQVGIHAQTATEVRSFRSHRDGITGSCELFDLGALTELESSARSVQALNDGIISPSPHPTSKCLLRIQTQALVLAERAFFLSYIPGMFQRDFALALF